MKEVINLKPGKIFGIEETACLGEKVSLYVVEEVIIDDVLLYGSSYDWRVYRDGLIQLTRTTEKGKLDWTPTLIGEYTIEVEINYLEHGTVTSELKGPVHIEDCPLHL